MEFDKKTGTISGKFKSIIENAVYTVVGQDFYDKYKTQVTISVLNITHDIPGIALSQFASSNVICRITENYIGRVVYHQHILDKILINSTASPEIYDFDVNSVYMEFYFVAKTDIVITFRLNATGGAILYVDNITNQLIKVEGCQMKSKNITIVMFKGYNFMKLDYSGMGVLESYLSLEYSLASDNHFKIVSKDETVIYSMKPGFMRYVEIEVASNTYVCDFPHIINGFPSHYSIYPSTLPKGLEFNNLTGRIMGKTIGPINSLTFYTVKAHSMFGDSKTRFYISVYDRIHSGVLKIIRTLTGHFTELNMFHSNNKYFTGYDEFVGCKLHDLYPKALDNAVQISSVTMTAIPIDANIHRICVRGIFLEVRIEINCTTYSFDYDGHCEDITLMNDCYYQTIIYEYFHYINDHDTVRVYFIGSDFTFNNPFFYSAKHVFYYEARRVKLYKSSKINILPIYDSNEIDEPDYYIAINTFPLGINMTKETGRIYGVTRDNSDLLLEQRIIASYDNESKQSYSYTIDFESDKLSPVYQIHYMDKNKNIIHNIRYMQYTNISNEIQPYIFGYLTNCIVHPYLPPGLYLTTKCEIIGNPTMLQPEIRYNITALNVEGGKSTLFGISIERCQYVTAVNISIDNYEELNKSEIMIEILNVSPILKDYLSINTPYQIFCLGDGMKNIEFNIIDYYHVNISQINVTMRFTNGGIIKKFILTTRKTVVDVIIINPPAELYYDPSDIEFQVGLLPKAIKPHYINTATLFLSQPTFPEGIYLNSKGEIVGVPLKVMNKTEYIIVACNENDCATTNITLTITAYGCYPVESYPPVPLGYSAYINCYYNEYGNRSRTCYTDVDGSPTWTKENISCLEAPTEPTPQIMLVTYEINIDITPSYFTLYHQHNLNYKIRNSSSIPIYYFTYKTVRPSTINDYSTIIKFQFSVSPKYKSSIIGDTNKLIMRDDFWVNVFEEEHTFTILSSSINEYIEEKDYSVICIISFSVLGFLVIVIGIVIFCKKTHRLHNVNPRFEIEYYLPFVNSGNVAMSPDRSASSYTNMNNIHSANSSPSRSHLVHNLTSRSLESEESETIVQI